MPSLRNLIPDMPTPGNTGTYIATPPAPVQWAKPKASSAPKKTTAKKSSSKKTTAKKSSSSSSSGGDGGVKKSADGAQVDALKRLLDGGFRSQMDERIANIDRAQREGDALLMSGYNTRLASLQDLRKTTRWLKARARSPTWLTASGKQAMCWRRLPPRVLVRPTSCRRS